MKITKEKIHGICHWVAFGGLIGVVIASNLSNHMLEVIFHIILWGSLIIYLFTEKDVKGTTKQLARLLLLIIFIALFFRYFPV